MKYEEFKQMVESHQVSPRNWQDYQKYKLLWAEMARKGDCLEILWSSQRIGILAGIVKYGHVEHPERWIDGTRTQKRALIRNGLYIEQLLQDDDPSVQLEIGYRHRPLLPDILKNLSAQRLMRLDLLNKVKPDCELTQILVDILQQKGPDTHENMEAKALELKLQEPEQPMTAIECTMDIQQLYSVQSEYWYRTLTGRQIANILYAEDQLHDKELVASEFGHLYDSGSSLSISTKVEKLKQEHHIGPNSY